MGGVMEVLSGGRSWHCARADRLDFFPQLLGDAS